MEPVRTLFAVTRAALRTVESAVDRALAPVGLDAVDFEILRTLEERQWSIESIGRSTGMERSMLSRRLSDLAARGLVVVDRQNQRRSRTSLTTEGKEVLAEANQRYGALHGRIAAALGDTAVQALLSFAEVRAARPEGMIAHDAPRGTS